MRTLLLNCKNLSALLVCLTQRAAAQFVELTAQLEFYAWSTTPTKLLRVHCVVGTDSWEMDGDFCRNCDQSYWFTGNRIIEHSIAKEAHAVTFWSVDPAAIGAELDRVSESVDGNPGTLSACGPNGRRLDVGPDRLCPMARIAWLAFCSGPCLRREGRKIFPPNDLWKEMICAPSGFLDQTKLLDDSLGLPKTVDLYTENRQPVLQYRVTESTNLLGWEFPLEFYLAQYRPTFLPKGGSSTNEFELDFSVKGKLTGIRVGTQPQLPAKFVKAKEK